jgi:hypothetical protein
MQTYSYKQTNKQTKQTNFMEMCPSWEAASFSAYSPRINGMITYQIEQFCQPFHHKIIIFILQVDVYDAEISLHFTFYRYKYLIKLGTF